MVTETEFPPVVENPPLDITGALVEYLRAHRQQRDDDHFAHFSDMGKCDAQIWARRRGAYDTRPAGGRLIPFGIGLWAEDEMFRALKFRFPDVPLFHGGLVVAEIGSPNNEFAFWACDDVGELDPAKSVIGHPDFYLEFEDFGMVIDAKTTTFPMRNGSRNAPGYARSEYVLQTAAYAVAYDEIYGNVPYFGVWSACKSGGGDELVTYRTADYRTLVLHRLRELLALTDPSAPEPPARPPNYSIRIITKGPRKGDEERWMCGYCDYVNCVSNENLGATFE